VGCLASISPAAPASVTKAPPYPLYPQFYEQAKTVVAGTGNGAALIKTIDEELAKVVLPVAKPADQKSKDAKLGELLTLRGAAELAKAANAKEVLPVLLDDPTYLSRFLHALKSGDNINGALGVLKTLRDYDEAKFKKNREFCIAFAVVWDDFHGYHWVDKKCGPVPEGYMLELYKYFLANESQMVIHPWDLPFELGVYVVHTRIPANERAWVLQNYGRNLNAYAIYKSVPWTMVLSPAHGKGEGLDYTLMNIKEKGGVCMEQAYFTEQVFRLHGVPAVFMEGQGRRPGGHAWVGVFLTTPKPHWDFSSGRYEQDRYYSGSSYDPTNCRRMLVEAQIHMATAVFGEGRASLANIEKSYTYCQAARWANAAMPEKTADTPPLGRNDLVLDLANEALKANPYNEQVWLLAFGQAKEKKMTADQAMAWARKLADLTLDAFPDYTVTGIGSFLDCTGKPDFKLETYEKMYNILSKARPDLACAVKVAEGDIWLEKGDVKRALQSYVYPMVNFSKDAQILGLAKKKLEAIGANGQGEETAKACKESLAALEKGQSTPERKEAVEIIRLKLQQLAQTPAKDAPAASDKPAAKP
jgi:tetratricopeptide (TPR) repeat protein